MYCGWQSKGPRIFDRERNVVPNSSKPFRNSSP